MHPFKHLRRGLLFSLLVLVALFAAFLTGNIAQRQITHAAGVSSSSATVYFGSDDGYLYALDASTGSLRWRFKANGVEDSPTLANGVLYVGSQDGYAYALNATTGALIWKFKTGLAIESSPAVVNHLVYIGSNDGYVYAVKAGTGVLQWRYYTTTANSSPTVANGVLYVGTYFVNGQRSGYVYALNASNGAFIWRYLTDSNVNLSKPIVVNNIVYTGSYDGYVYALQANNGQLVWRTQGSGCICFFSFSPAVANGKVYVGENDNDPQTGFNDVYAFNASSGAIVWQSQGSALAGVAVANNRVYVPIYNGSTDYLNALHADTGQLQWQAKGNYSTPTVYNGVVYVGSSSLNSTLNYLNAFNATTGTFKWRYQVGGAILDAPTVA